MELTDRKLRLFRPLFGDVKFMFFVIMDDAPIRHKHLISISAGFACRVSVTNHLPRLDFLTEGVELKIYD